MARFVFVHGASHAGWCWQRVVDRLRAAGHEAEAPDLPAHGDDDTPIGSVGMSDYVQRVVDALNASESKAILVSHSMGGLAATGAAEAAPEKVSNLVYLTAYAPLDGDSVGSLLGGDPSSKVPAATELVDGGVAVQVADASVIPIFYNDCSAADAADAKARLTPEPSAPMMQPVAVTPERAGKLARHYIGCTQDQCIDIGYQRALASRSGSAWLGEIDAGHSPFLSQPDRLTAMLVALA